MNSPLTFAAIGLAALAVVLSAVSLLNSPSGDGARGPTNEAMREFILNNPDVILESVQRMQERERTEALEAQKRHVAANIALVDETPGIHVLGDPNAEVTIIEFFDYHCGYCKQALPAVMTLLEEEKNIRVKFVEFPILREESWLAAKASVAADKQGKYMEMHTAMMESDGILTRQRIEQIAVEIGLDLDRLRTDMTAPRTEKIVEAHHALGRTLRIDGTPTFIVNGELVVGLDVADIRKRIRAASGG